MANCGGSAADSDCTLRFCISSPAENQPREGFYEVIKSKQKGNKGKEGEIFICPLCPY
jgi:hypothetical protein